VKQGTTDLPDRKSVREWAITELQTHLLLEVKRRVEVLSGIPASHKAEAEDNKEWVIRCQNELSNASEAMKAAQEQARQARAAIAENERWISRALPSEVSTSRAGIQKSREWLRQADGRIRFIQDNIEKQKHDLATATERDRMHSYLAYEASAELTWLEVLEARLRDTTALAAAVSIDW
jgi:chromosome segregation ATPase